VGCVRPTLPILLVLLLALASPSSVSGAEGDGALRGHHLFGSLDPEGHEMTGATFSVRSAPYGPGFAGFAGEDEADVARITAVYGEGPVATEVGWMAIDMTSAYWDGSVIPQGHSVFYAELPAGNWLLRIVTADGARSLTISVGTQEEGDRLETDHGMYRVLPLFDYEMRDGPPDGSADVVLPAWPRGRGPPEAFHLEGSVGLEGIDARSLRLTVASVDGDWSASVGIGEKDETPVGEIAILELINVPEASFWADVPPGTYVVVLEAEGRRASRTVETADTGDRAGEAAYMMLMPFRLEPIEPEASPEAAAASGEDAAEERVPLPGVVAVASLAVASLLLARRRAR
jgi:hypothetical protein